MDSKMPITFYQHIKQPAQVAVWEQLDQRGNTPRRLTSPSNEERITPCDISHHLLEAVTHFKVPEHQREVCQFKLLSLKDQRKIQQLKARDGSLGLNVKTNINSKLYVRNLKLCTYCK